MHIKIEGFPPGPNRKVYFAKRFQDTVDNP